MKIDINILKKLRNVTNISITDCKEALIKSNFNLNKAISYLKNKNFIYKNNKNLNKHNEIVISYNTIDNDYGFILNIISNTDFILKNKKIYFLENKISNFCLTNKIKSLNLIINKFKKYINYLEYQFKAKIILDNFFYLEKKFIKSYTYRNKISALIVYDNNININKNHIIFKKISMHIIFNQPKYIYINNVLKKKIKTKINFYKKLCLKDKLNISDINIILNKKIKNFINNNVLEKQKFLCNDNLSIKKVLKKYNLKINYIKILKSK